MTETELTSVVEERQPTYLGGYNVAVHLGDDLITTMGPYYDYYKAVDVARAIDAIVAAVLQRAASTRITSKAA
jgi:hypothetical protein